MTRKEVRQIPKMFLTMTTNEVAAYFKVHPRTITRWIRILRNRGFSVPEVKRGGRPALELGPPPILKIQ